MDNVTLTVIHNPTATEKLLQALRELPGNESADDAALYVRYSWRFCEACESKVRQLLVRFADGSCFAVCLDCCLDLSDLVELFGLDCSIEPF